MTTTTAPMTTTPSRTPLIATFGVVAAALLTGIGTFWDITGNDPGDSHDDKGVEYLIALGLIAVCAAIVFGLVVRTAANGNPGRRAVVLGVLAVLTVAVAWAGFPMVIAAGAVACALTRRDQEGSLGTAGRVALGLCALSAVGSVAFAISG